MILSPLSKVVLEAWGKCVLGYTLLPNCCAENGLHPCIIFQVGKPNTPQSSFSGVATIPKQAWQIDFCVHKSTTCYSQELAKSKKSLHALKTLVFPIYPPSPKGVCFVLFPFKFNPHGTDVRARPNHPLIILCSVARDIYINYHFSRQFLFGYRLYVTIHYFETTENKGGFIKRLKQIGYYLKQIGYST